MTKEWKKQRRFRQKFARLLQMLLQKPLLQPPYTGALSNIVILAQEKYGDAILLTSLLKLLKKNFPETSVHVVTFSRAVYGFFQSDRNIDRLHLAKHKAWRYYREILTKRFDLLFNTKDHPSTSFLLHSLVIRAARKAGIDCEFHRGIYDYLVDLDYHTPVALKNCGLLSILGKPFLPEECRPYIPEHPVSEPLRSFVESLHEHSCIGLNISAGGPTRYWTEENWKKLVEAFPDERFIVFSAPGDLPEKHRLELQCQNIVRSPATANLYEARLLVQKLRLLVTPDTALVHVASCSGTPVLGLYGIAPQDQSRFRPLLIKSIMVVSPTALVSDIKPETVIAGTRELLA
ncbi:MAG: glycosyltransferase family 9 protein [Chlorobi bacterium]|nr:glycosyltransferase family 9 protein [Chlorobiota bacterium]